MYMQPLRCKVTGAKSTAPVAAAKPAVWCEDDSSKCVSGAKQLLFWHQAAGDNIEVQGSDLLGEPKSPAYNAKCGWANGSCSCFTRMIPFYMYSSRFTGAQNNIFQASKEKRSGFPHAI